MRTIKFRVWNSERMITEKLFFFLSIDFDGSLNNNGHPVINVMEYSGANDKNKKEIFESDIIKIISLNKCFEVIHHKCAFGIKITEELFSPLYHSDDMEVVGNIYENTELLKP